MIADMLAAMPDQLPVELSRKMQLAREILELSIKAKDKILIFSQSLPTLGYMEELLEEMDVSYERIDGKKNVAKRDSVLQHFNDDKFHTQVLLISTRAGGVGLNIQSANRVIIMDYSFNPTWEEQAIGRAYRLGQQKPVHVYRFVAAGTFEKLLYNIGLFKTSLAQRVVDKKNPARNAEKKPSDWLFMPQEVKQEKISKEAGKDPHVLDKIIARHSSTNDTFIRGIKTMETLQMDAEDEPLNDEERKEVEAEIQEKKMRNRMASDTGGVGAATQVPRTAGGPEMPVTPLARANGGTSGFTTQAQAPAQGQAQGQRQTQSPSLGRNAFTQV